MTEIAVAMFGAPGAAPVLRGVDRPVPGTHAALIAVIACGLDIGDVRLHAGRGIAAYPTTLGRHFVGAIEALGTGLAADAEGNRLRPGTPVLVPSLIPCGQCESCRMPSSGGGWCQTPATPLAGLSDAVLLDRAVLARAALHALPLTMPPWLATLVEPFADCLHALGRAQRIGRLRAGSVVVVHGSSAAALLMVAAALELGAGRVVAVGGSDVPFLRLARQCGAEATIDAAEVTDPDERVAIVRETVGGRGADLAVTCDGDPPPAREALAGLRDGGAYLDCGPGFESDPAALPWHLVRRRHLAILGSAGHAAEDIPVAIRLLYRARARYPWAAMHERFPFTAQGIGAALAAVAGARVVRALVTQRPDLAG